MKWFWCVVFFGAVFPVRAVSSDVSFLQQQAQLHVRNGEWDGAVRAYETLLQQRPKEEGLYADAILAALNCDSVAVLAFVDMGRFHGVDRDALTDTLQVRSRRRGNKASYERFLRLLKREKPQWNDFLDRRLAAYYRFDRQDEALLQALREVRIRDPYDETLWAEEGQILFRLGDTEAACETFRALLDRNPRSLPALLFWGNYRYATGTARIASSQHRYRQLKNPTRMDFIVYKQQQIAEIDTSLAEARHYFEQAVRIRSTEAVRSMLAEIDRINHDVTAQEYVAVRSK